MSFASLGLSDALVRAVAATGYTTPTPVQTQAIPAVLEGRDLMVAAQTGTGKTAGFSLPILELLFPGGQRPSGYKRTARQVRAVVLTPTRELAAQVYDSMRSYATELRMHAACSLVGGGGSPRVQRLAAGRAALGARAGLLRDLVRPRALDVSAVEDFLLADADQRLRMGFNDDLKRVHAQLPAQHQRALFSA